ncbi:DUF4190 domain-containing protein [Cryobacterium melibiosiphilum]|uniref:DUF4190 domain-containing protein n=1 Tax=Cryobacterium melibiosiphilum TaxID=995039 RepID=A0A3A5MW68_9MICO|nr:DUF4190 domain-containing protein [Cryobacterium melibiosiphilum]RJT92019.1 DUF4190 domain-containing protein [Cryobacterium melibiosiphilum]
MLNNLVGWHILVLLSFLLILVPIAGITFTLLLRKKAKDAGQATEGPGLNVLAVVGFIISLLALSIPAVICGHLALKQIKTTHDRGWGFATTSLWIGYYGIAVGGLALAVSAGTAMARF